MMTPPIGVPDFSMSAAASPFLTTQPQPVPNIPIQPHGMLGGLLGGMFGGGKINIGNVIAGALSGYLAQRGNPVGVAGLQSMLQAKQLRQQQALEDQHRQQQLQDQMTLFDYKAAHAGPDDFTQRVQALNQLKPGLGDTYAQNYARNGGGLGLITNPQTGQQFAQPGSVQPPAEAIARLKANPAEAQQFDEIFGHGASAGILGAGGPSPQGSGGF